MTSLISAVSWIPRGAAAQHPTKYVTDAAELERVGKLAKFRLEDAELELALAQADEGEGEGESGDEENENGDENEEGWEE